MTIHGNRNSQGLTLEATRADSLRSVLLYGPSHVGKLSFVTEVLRQAVEDPDMLSVDGSVSGAREAVDFAVSAPVFSPYRVIVVDGADRLSDAAQDAYLRLCEEPPPTCRTFLVAEDEGNMAPALLSRMDSVIRWSALGRDEMSDFIEAQPVTEDPVTKELSAGRPGLYLAMFGKPEYPALRTAVSRILDGFESSVPEVPDAVDSLKSGPSVEKDAVSLVCRACALSVVGTAPASLIRKILLFSSLLSRVPSANAGIHWQRMLLRAPM